MQDDDRDTLRSPSALVAIARAAHVVGDRELERSAKGVLRDEFDIELRFRRKQREAGCSMSAAFLTPPAVAKRFGVKPETVLGWIRSGELRGLNVARRGATRPRFRVAECDLATFEAGRTVQGPAARPVRRRHAASNIIQFF